MNASSSFSSTSVVVQHTYSKSKSSQSLLLKHLSETFPAPDHPHPTNPNNIRWNFCVSRERVLVWGGSRCYSRRKREKVLFVSETERVSALTVRERERKRSYMRERRCITITTSFSPMTLYCHGGKLAETVQPSLRYLAQQKQTQPKHHLAMPGKI